MREELKGGSMTTLNGHLQFLRGEDESKRSLEDLEMVSPELVTTVMNLHGQLQAAATSEAAKAQQKFEHQMKVAEDARADLQAKLEASLAQSSRLEQDLVAARAMYNAERESLVTAREQIAVLNCQVAGQAEKLNDLKGRLQASQDETRRAHAQRDHYQTAVSEERNRERAEHASAFSQQEAQNDYLRKELVTRIEQLTRTNIRIVALEHEVTSTQAVNVEIRSAHARLIEQLDSQENTIAKLRQNLDLAVVQERDLLNEARRANANLAEAKQRIAISEVQLTHAKGENDTLSEKAREAEALVESFRKLKDD